jgi:hypothetical protein
MRTDRTWLFALIISHARSVGVEFGKEHTPTILAYRIERPIFLAPATVLQQSERAEVATD